MVTLFSAVVGTVVVFVPVLISGSTGEDGVVGKGDNGPIFTCELVAGRDEAGCIEDFEYVGDDACCDAFFFFEGFFFEIVNAFVDFDGDAQVFGGKDDNAPACKICDQTVGCGICEGSKVRCLGVGTHFFHSPLGLRETQ